MIVVIIVLIIEMIISGSATLQCYYHAMGRVLLLQHQFTTAMLLQEL